MEWDNVIVWQSLSARWAHTTSNIIWWIWELGHFCLFLFLLVSYCCTLGFVWVGSISVSLQSFHFLLSLFDSCCGLDLTKIHLGVGNRFKLFFSSSPSQLGLKLVLVTLSSLPWTHFKWKSNLLYSPPVLKKNNFGICLIQLSFSICEPWNFLKFPTGGDLR